MRRAYVVALVSALCLFGLAHAITPDDRAPLARFEPAVVSILDTGAKYQVWLSGYSPHHVAIKVYDNMQRLVGAYADAVPPEQFDAFLKTTMTDYAAAAPPERLDAILNPLGYVKTSKGVAMASGVSVASKAQRLEVRGPFANLFKSQPAATNAQRAMQELSAIEADRLTDAAIAAEVGPWKELSK